MRVKVTDSGCWEFPGAKCHGYGVVGITRGKNAFTHRVTYEALVGPIPDGLDLDHLCRNRACCNPAHLEPVTRRENIMRGDRKMKQTHCANGHEFTPENTISRQKQRVCRTCYNARRRAYRAKTKETK